MEVLGSPSWVVRGGADFPSKVSISPGGELRRDNFPARAHLNSQADFTHSTVLRKYRQSSLKFRIITHHLLLSHAFQFFHFSSCMIFGSSLTCNR